MEFNNKKLIIIFSGLILFSADKILKYLFYHQKIEDNFLFNYTQNLGIAFGFPLQKAFLILFYIIVAIIILSLIALLIECWRQKKYFEVFSVWLIILGAASNIIDRIKFGFVIDYIDLHIWPVFNIADMMIVGGVFLLLTKILHQSPPRKTLLEK